MELIISSVKEEAENVKTFGLKPAAGGKLSYYAGQFLTFSDYASGREFRRSYSLSSAPGVDEFAAITVKRIANGMFSRRLIDRAAAGDTLRTIGDATGIFTFPDDISGVKAAWFFAAGIGITSVFSIIKWALRNRPSLMIVLVYSNRSPEETIFYEALLQLQRDFTGQLSICWLWSNTRDLQQARLSRVSFAYLLAHYLTQPVTSVRCYTCGPRDYMWMVQLLLREAGVPAAAIRREVFSFEEKIPHAMPPDIEAHRIRAKIGGKEYAFTTQYPDTILSSAKKAGIPLPYSCNAGQCGSCTAICTKGKVWASYNAVLTANDIASGRVLTCTGYAIGGDVVIEL